jgi:hypothetical protein
MKTETTTTRIQDPIIDEVRKAGEDLAKESGYDLHVLCERLRESENLDPKRYHRDNIK